MLTRIPFSGMFRLAFALICACSAGCATRITTTAERLASISPYERTRIGAQPLQEFLLRRSAFLISGNHLIITPSTDNSAHNRRGFQLELGKATSFRCGTASAIDRRGYFLTASHNIESDPPYLAFYKNGHIQFERARVVWRGDLSEDEPDMAILAVPVALDAVFQWSTSFKPGDRVVAAGLNSDQVGIFQMACLAGELLKTAERPDPAPGKTLIFHRTPVHPGDSGGPLVGTDGRLLAINVEIRPENLFMLRPEGPLTVAERPPLPWLRTLIDRDATQTTRR